MSAPLSGEAYGLCVCVCVCVWIAENGIKLMKSCVKSFAHALFELANAKFPREGKTRRKKHTNEPRNKYRIDKSERSSAELCSELVTGRYKTRAIERKRIKYEKNTLGTIQCKSGRSGRPCVTRRVVREGEGEQLEASQVGARKTIV